MVGRLGALQLLLYDVARVANAFGADQAHASLAQAAQLLRPLLHADHDEGGAMATGIGFTFLNLAVSIGEEGEAAGPSHYSVKPMSATAVPV